MSCIASTQWTTLHGRLLLVASLEPREIGRRIARARDRKGWTQLAFALEADVSPSTVQRWESGKLPPVRELIRVAELLGVAADELVEPDPMPSGADDVAELRAEVERLLREVQQERLENRERLERIEALLETRRSA